MYAVGDSAESKNTPRLSLEVENFTILSEVLCVIAELFLIPSTYFADTIIEHDQVHSRLAAIG